MSVYRDADPAPNEADDRKDDEYLDQGDAASDAPKPREL